MRGLAIAVLLAACGESAPPQTDASCMAMPVNWMVFGTSGDNVLERRWDMGSTTVIVDVQRMPGTRELVGITDTGGNTWQRAVQNHDDPDHLAVDIWYMHLAHQYASITLTYSAPAQLGGQDYVLVAEWTCTQKAPPEVTATNTVQQAASVSAGMFTASQRDLVIGAVAYDATNVTQSFDTAGLANDFDFTGASLTTEIAWGVVPPGDYSLDWTTSVSVRNAAGAVVALGAL
jgi:hypothetical protein